MEAIKISEHVWWVGAIDWGLRDFHGYTTSRGSTYNAYLVIYDEAVLVDTVKKPFMGEMMERISSVIEPKKISYIISNHAEMDHSGCLPEVINEICPKKVFTSSRGKKALFDHFGLDNLTAVEDAQKIELGGAHFVFIDTPMLHWPESIFSYLAGDGILFSQDVFGMHLATSKLFDDEVAPYILETEAKKYYANIITPYSNLVLDLLKKWPSLNLDIKIIAPDHGPIWRSDTKSIIDWYKKWALGTTTLKSLVVFDTMWKSTEQMALHIADGITSEGVEAKVMPLYASNRSDVATELLDAGAACFGTPVLNGQMFPTVADVMTYIKGLKFKNKIGVAFGSYGWNGSGIDMLEEEMKKIGMELVEPALKVRYVPKDEDLKRCVEIGKSVAIALKERSGGNYA